MNRSIKQRNAFYEKLMFWLDDYKTDRCGWSRGCGGGYGCHCDRNQRIPVFELEIDEMDTFIELALDERDNTE